MADGQTAGGHPSHPPHATTGAGTWLVWLGLALVGAQLLAAAAAALLRLGQGPGPAGRV
jgi:hypothetical protein